MAAIKFRYQRQYAQEAQFISAIRHFVQVPQKEDALMIGAVAKFGVMNSLALPDSTLNRVAEYIYEYELEKPSWFDQHFEEQHGKNGMQAW